jgi:hypothetical protein
MKPRLFMVSSGWCPFGFLVRLRGSYGRRRGAVE